MRFRIGSAVENINNPVGRVEIYVEPRDIWVGAYVAENAVYVCPLPLLVFRISRGRAS